MDRSGRDNMVGRKRANPWTFRVRAANDSVRVGDDTSV